MNGDDGLLLVIVEDEEIVPFCNVIRSESEGYSVLNLGEDLAEQGIVSCHCFAFYGGHPEAAPWLDLRKDRDQILPAETTSAALDDIVVVAAAPSLRAFAGSFESGIEDGLGKSAHCFTNLSVLFEVDEVADTLSHLLLCFLYEHCLTDAHIGGAGLGGDSGDVASNESVVGGGGDDGSHIQKAL